MKTHLRTRPCSAMWCCVVCPRPAARTFVVLQTLLVLCKGSAAGFERILHAP